MNMNNTMNTPLKARYSFDLNDLDTTLSIATRDEEEIHNFTVDPLVLSCVAYRFKNAPENHASVLTNPLYWSITSDVKHLTSSIKEEDIQLAQNIRTYYNGKLIVNKLRSENTTRFRTDLGIFLNLDSTEGFNIPSKFLGMIYKLPYFYEYDRALIDICDGEYRTVIGPMLKTKCKLTFIKKLDTYHKSKKVVFEYWFSDEKDNRVMLTIEKHNPLRSLLDYYIEDNFLHVTGSFVRAHKDTIEFYNSKIWEFDKETTNELD